MARTSSASSGAPPAYGSNRARVCVGEHRERAVRKSCCTAPMRALHHTSAALAFALRETLVEAAGVAPQWPMVQRMHAELPAEPLGMERSSGRTVLSLREALRSASSMCTSRMQMQPHGKLISCRAQGHPC